MGVATPVRADEIGLDVSALIAGLSLDRKIGQLMISHVYGPAADSADQRNLRRFGVATPTEAVVEFGLGGVIYFRWSDNLLDPGQIAELSRGLRSAARSLSPVVDLDISTDQETGAVSRIGRPLTEFPGAMALAATGSLDLARQVYAVTGAELRALGISTDFAPTVDVNVNPANPVINVRSFGSRAEAVAEFGVAAVDGLQCDAAISAAAKHFPGHGDTAADSHETLPVITHDLDTWRRIDRPPFAAAVAAGVDLIMTAHLSFPGLDPSGDPATLSRPILTGLLRDDLGYDGVVITDSLEMAGVRSRYSDGEVAVRALEAGADILLMPAHPLVARDAVRQAVQDGRLTENRIDRSLTRVLAWKASRARREAEVAPLPIERVADREHIALARRVAEQAVTLVRGPAADDASLLPLTGRVAVVGPDQPVASVSRRLIAAGVDVTDGDGVAAEVVLLLSRDAWTDPVQQDLIRSRCDGPTPVVHVAIKDPYDLAFSPDAGAALACYSDTEVALSALVRVLCGVVQPTGRLPVDLQPAGGGAGHST